MATLAALGALGYAKRTVDLTREGRAQDRLGEVARTVADLAMPEARRIGGRGDPFRNPLQGRLRSLLGRGHDLDKCRRLAASPNPPDSLYGDAQTEIEAALGWAKPPGPIPEKTNG